MNYVPIPVFIQMLHVRVFHVTVITPDDLGVRSQFCTTRTTLSGLGRSEARAQV